MLIGLPQEIKNHEYRVGLTPASVRDLCANGHSVLVQTGAGAAIGLTDAQYQAAGAQIAPDAASVFAQADMIVKVKEPQAQECAMLRPGQILYTYLHLAPDPAQTAALVKSGAVCIAYETITGANGGLPGGVPGVPAAHVVILGGGVVGTHALQVAVGMGARVTVIDRNVDRLRQLDLVFGNRIHTLYSSVQNLEDAVLDAELVIGGVLIPGAFAPKLVTRAMVSSMKRGAVVVDVAIDQGGCFETSHATTHAEPTYVVDDVVHYCVANMPGAVARTSTFALNNATIGHALAIANKGWKQALREDVHLRQGLNVAQGQVTYEAVAQTLGYAYVPAEGLVA